MNLLLLLRSSLSMEVYNYNITRQWISNCSSLSDETGCMMKFLASRNFVINSHVVNTACKLSFVGLLHSIDEDQMHWS